MSFTVVDGIAIAAVLLGIPLLMLVVRALGRYWHWSPEVTRKAVHVGTGGIALLFPLLFSNPLPVLVLLGLAIPMMLVIRTGLGNFGSVLHGVERRSFGEIYLALAIAITFLRAGAEPVLYVLPILVITLSDTAAALVGTAYGRQRFPVEGGAKSLEGVVVFFVVTWLAALIVLVLMADAPPLNLVLIAMLIAAFCALVEVDSWRGLDNLFVPVGALLLLERALATTPTDLAITAAVFVAALLGVLAAARWLRLPVQAARAYAILLFLIIAIVDLHNVVLPALAICAHLVAHLLRSCSSRRPDFDLLFAAAMASLFWMVVGDIGDRSVISLFNLTFAGAALGFLALALTGLYRLLLVPAAVLLGVLVLWAVHVNLPFSRWFMLTPVEIAAALAVAVVLPLLRPRWFDRARSLFVFGLAMLVPLLLCIRGFALP